jgi:phospholipase C
MKNRFFYPLNQRMIFLPKKQHQDYLQLFSFFLIGVLLLTFSAANAQLSWKKFNGSSFSADYVSGGEESGPNKVPICRCEYQGGIHPGKFKMNGSDGINCSIGWGGKEVLVKDFEILYNDDGVPLKWVEVTNGKLPENAIVGGQENGKNLYIGRVKQSEDNAWHPGKVFVSNGQLICNYSWRGQEIVENNKFYVLVEENEAFELSVLTYNVMLLPKFTFPNHMQDHRADKIPGILKEQGQWDVVIFNEAFSNEARVRLTILMAMYGYYYYTEVVDKSGNLENGGVFIHSRYPIETTSMLIYDDCTGTVECGANKGAVYVKIEKDGQYAHIFGTHLQSDRGPKESAVREKQLRQLANFAKTLTSEAKERSEPVIFAGDFNFCYYNDNFEYKRALGILNAELENPRTGKNEWTFDPQYNSIAEYRYPDDPKQWLDYILASKMGKMPTSSFYKVHKFRVGKKYYMHAHGDPLDWFENGTYHYDLSDHYALSAYFKFE